jgi:hypothetical protein
MILGPDLDADSIRALLSELGRRLDAQGLRAELFIVGGAAMALAYDGRRTTTDIDAIIKPRDVVIETAIAMAREHKLPDGWLNDAVVTMMPPHEDRQPRTIGQFGGLSLVVASPEYMLAMKAMISRKSPSDLDDAALLCRELGIVTVDAVERVVGRYFGPGAFGAQELWFEDIVDRVQSLPETL